MNLYTSIGYTLALIFLGYYIGAYREKEHLRSIRDRERKYRKIKIHNLKEITNSDDEIDSSSLVSGSAVISIDYFKRFIASIRLLFGGRVKSYETLVDRARREAVLRMIESAGQCDYIANVRIETSTIGFNANAGKQSSVGSLEAIAYGTKVKLK